MQQSWHIIDSQTVAPGQFFNKGVQSLMLFYIYEQMLKILRTLIA